MAIRNSEIVAQLRDEMGSNVAVVTAVGTAVITAVVTSVVTAVVTDARVDSKVAAVTDVGVGSNLLGVKFGEEYSRE